MGGSKSTERRAGQRARAALTERERQEKSLAAAARVTALCAWKEAQAVLCYVPFETELSTWPLLERALEEKKALYCPAVLGEGRMAFYRIHATQELVPGFRGILEPSGTGECWTPKEGPALMLVPGSAFDRRGRRIGYGGGYYDRFLGSLPLRERPFLTGLCFSCQLFPRLAVQPHDMRMDLVITERGGMEDDRFDSDGKTGEGGRL
ncbi:MAG: 5-formyltetrahydrofolate cyclo-ligase [Eubacteriales bacterium]|nr:5-formyltetrahydrofolate cyclo-ligase [Eubacteriales bacterium]